MKHKLLTLALLLTVKLSAFAAIDLGSATPRTPYDPYMQPVKEVFRSIQGQPNTMDRVHDLMARGRAFRYSHTDPYNPARPEQTAARRVGDCKDKSLWLCDQLQDPSARFVIGKMKRSSRISHAWVMWQHEGRWWILDCTMTTRPIAADKLSPNEYVPLFSYSKGTAYRHTGSASLFAEVAAKKKAPVAAKTAKTDRRIAAN